MYICTCNRNESVNKQIQNSNGFVQAKWSLYRASTVLFTHFTNLFQRWTSSAPYRTITVRDIMSDLPPIRNGEQKLVTKYDGLPECHFQRMMRKNTTDLTDHICKQMNALVEKRMELIPTEQGSDWRDLPNIVSKLSDGTYSQKLVYSYHDVVQVVITVLS